MSVESLCNWRQADPFDELPVGLSVGSVGSVSSPSLLSPSSDWLTANSIFFKDSAPSWTVPSSGLVSTPVSSLELRCQPWLDVH